MFGSMRYLAHQFGSGILALKSQIPHFHQMFSTRSISRLALGFVVLFTISGCSGCQSSPQASASSNNELKQLGGQFMDFFRARGNKTPADEKEFKDFITANMTDVKKKLLGITDIEKLF